MRFIKKDINNPRARTRLSTDTCVADVENSVQARKGIYSSSRYGHDEVREELQGIYLDKCAFCESKIAPVATANVEHFRPKAKVSGVNDNGYYWLGNEWTNLLLACPSCNGAKSTKFPLLHNNHLNDHPVNQDGSIDYSKFPTNSNYYLREQPLLMNPEELHPEQYLYIDYFGKLVPINNNLFGRTTIQEIKLNRDALVSARLKVINDIINRIEEQILERYGDDPLSNNQYQRQLNKIFKEMLARVHQESEYTMVGNCMIERFDELILEDIDPFFRKEIRGFFIDFLNGI